MSNRFVVLSGCSGGGKSSLLAELERRGHQTVAEPGRRIVRTERERGGTALPWIDLMAFAHRAIAMAQADLERAAMLKPGWIFFDRGLIDARVALANATGQELSDTPDSIRPYNGKVFLTPPWPEIYVVDAERRHGFDAAVHEYRRLQETYNRLGYRTVVLPQTTVGVRADLVLSELGSPPP